MAFDREHVLVQEYVPGEVHDACVLCEHGEIRAGLTQKRLRAYPAEGGIGTVVETTQEPELLDRARTLLQALRWHGPAQVEFKVDPQTGRTWLLEINGRFWGSTGVAIRAGINFPLLTCKLALAEDLGSSPEYAVGLRYRFPFPFGLLALAERGSRRQSLRDFFAPRRDTFSDLMWSDPLPLIAEVLYIGRRAWQRRSLRAREAATLRPAYPAAGLRAQTATKQDVSPRVGSRSRAAKARSNQRIGRWPSGRRSCAE